MYSNPGRKLMFAAKLIFWLGAIASVLYCAFIVAINIAGSAWLEGLTAPMNTAFVATPTIVAAVLTLVFGLFGSWLVSLILYNIGKLVDNSDHVAASVRPAYPPIAAPQLRQTEKPGTK